MHFIQYRTWLFYLLQIIYQAFGNPGKGIKWIALSKNRTLEKEVNDSKVCHLLTQFYKHWDTQVQVCNKYYELMPEVIGAAILAQTKCQDKFQQRRWNCSSITLAPNFRNDLTSGTREQAFVYSISAAALAFTVTKGCKEGISLRCPCYSNRRKRRRRNDFEWYGCEDTVRFGNRISKRFMEEGRRFSSRSLDTDNTEKRLLLMNQHNAAAGRRIVARSRKQKCKCYGMSGSCTQKVCWQAIGSFESLTSTMKAKYVQSERVVLREERSRKTKRLTATLVKAPANHQHNTVKGLSNSHPRKSSLVHLITSPDYCYYDEKTGSFGTQGRRCNNSLLKEADGGCDSMCCGRGYRSRVVQRIKKCNCTIVKYKVECQACRILEEQSFCR